MKVTADVQSSNLGVERGCLGRVVTIPSMRIYNEHIK